MCVCEREYGACVCMFECVCTHACLLSVDIQICVCALYLMLWLLLPCCSAWEGFFGFFSHLFTYFCFHVIGHMLPWRNSR